jgi:hypothetical protein
LRAILAALLMLASPALAEEWTQHVDERYGFQIDIPASFEQVRDPALGATTLYYKTPVADLFIDTNYQEAASFEADMRKGVQLSQDMLGATVLESVITPTEAALLLTQGGKQVRSKTILLCGQDYVARYRLEYFTANAQLYAPLIDHLDRSFRRTASC